ncbi:MAG TPA: hypothetical protein HA306_07730 [Methanosarcina sp.]|nr:hypothetical protein [Methanosarcina sp.]
MLSDLSLLIQISAFFLLIYAVYRRRKSIASHGKIASVAFYLVLPAIFYMVYNRAQGLTLPYYNWILSFHMLLGIMTIITGIIFVTNQWKWKIKKYMDLEILLWTGTFLLGITVYILLFYPVLLESVSLLRFV